MALNNGGVGNMLSFIALQLSPIKCKSFNIEAQVVGHIEEGKRSLTIHSEFGTFEY